jgi:hypothetical protein
MSTELTQEEALQWVTENTKVNLEAYHGDL